MCTVEFLASRFVYYFCMFSPVAIRSQELPSASVISSSFVSKAVVALWCVALAAESQALRVPNPRITHHDPCPGRPVCGQRLAGTPFFRAPSRALDSRFLQTLQALCQLPLCWRCGFLTVADYSTNINRMRVINYQPSYGRIALSSRPNNPR